MLRLSSARQLSVALVACLVASAPLVGQRPAVTPASPRAATTVSVERDPRHRWTTVSYLSGDLIYIDAGITAGLREKGIVDVVRRDSVIATMEVQFVSSTRAAARTTRGSGVVIGDSVRFLPAADALIMSAPGARATNGTDRTTAVNSLVGDRRRTSRTVSGRVGFRYLSLETGSGSNGKLTQPAVDLRLEAHRMDGTPFGLVIDARAHRQRSAGGRIEGSTRIYQTQLEYQPIGAFPVRITAGRQLSNVLSPLGFFDGLTIDFDRRHWRVGALAGTQPDYANFRPSGAIREAGAWIQWHSAPGASALFQTTLGGVISSARGGINREFALLSAMYVRPVLSLYATQEIDVNRGWRREAELGHGITPTSTFATARLQLPAGFALNSGYDSRRNVRVYRDFLTPDVEFDDALRRGYWGGLSFGVPHVYASVDSRTSDGATVGRSQSNTATLSVSRLTVLGFGLRARGTTYEGPTVAGTVTSASVEVNPWGRLRVEASLGQRHDRYAQTGMLPARTSWVGFDADAGIGRSWYAMLSSYREVGAVDRLLQQYAALSWRF